MLVLVEQSSTIQFVQSLSIKIPTFDLSESIIRITKASMREFLQNNLIFAEIQNSKKVNATFADCVSADFHMNAGEAMVFT